MAKKQCWEEIETTFPYEYILQGQKLKALYWIQQPATELSHKPHYWIYGEPGSGKSAIIEVLWPGYYAKRTDGDWGGYQNQEAVYVGDMDPQGFQRIGSTYLKTWCDPQGFNANRKYAGGDHIIIKQLLVTSNFRIYECFKPGTQGQEKLQKALNRRFTEISITELLHQHQIKLRPLAELAYLKSINNTDYSRCFMHVQPTSKVKLTPYPYEDKTVKQELIDTHTMNIVLENSERDEQVRAIKKEFEPEVIDLCSDMEDESSYEECESSIEDSAESTDYDPSLWEPEEEDHLQGITITEILDQRSGVE